MYLKLRYFYGNVGLFQPTSSLPLVEKLKKKLLIYIDGKQLNTLKSRKKRGKCCSMHFKIPFHQNRCKWDRKICMKFPKEERERERGTGKTNLLLHLTEMQIIFLIIKLSIFELLLGKLTKLNKIRKILI